MIRNLLISTILLAATFGSVAQARDIRISVIGKNESTIRKELAAAARAACADANAPDQDECVEKTFDRAILDLEKIKKIRFENMTF